MLGSLCIFQEKMLSQNSIFFVNGLSLNSKVIEVNNTNIKYYKATNPTGPLYVISKNEVIRIKYADNFIDSFFVSLVNKHNTVLPKLEVRNKSIYAFKKKINTGDLLSFINAVEDSVSKIKLITEFELMKKYQRKRLTNRTFGILMLGGNLVYGLIYGAILYNPIVFAVFAGIGLTFFIPTATISLINKKKYFKQMNVVVNTFNQLK